MNAVSVFEAKTNLSRYIAALKDSNDEIVILKSGRPVAKLIRFEENTGSRIGEAKGILPVMGDLEEFDSLISEAEFEAEGRI